MGSIKVATSLERGVCSSYTTGKPSPSLLSWSGLALASWVPGFQAPSLTTTREKRGLLFPKGPGPRIQSRASGLASLGLLAVARRMLCPHWPSPPLDPGVKSLYTLSMAIMGRSGSPQGRWGWSYEDKGIYDGRRRICPLRQALLSHSS